VAVAVTVAVDVAVTVVVAVADGVALGCADVPALSKPKNSSVGKIFLSDTGQPLTTSAIVPRVCSCRRYPATKI